MSDSIWILRTLALSRALSRHGDGISFMVRRGLLTFVGRMAWRGMLSANNDNGRGAA